MRNIKSENQNKKNSKNSPKIYVDYDIFNGKIRLVQENSSETEIIERDEAIERAKSLGKNLIQISYNKNLFPHAICKIIDYGKYKYELQKKEKAAKKASRAASVDLKEISFSLNIDVGDFNTKIKHIKNFLENKKTKVKITVIAFKGRKPAPTSQRLLLLAKDLMKKILSNFDGLAELDSQPIVNNGFLISVLKAI